MAALSIVNAALNAKLFLHRFPDVRSAKIPKYPAIVSRCLFNKLLTTREDSSKINVIAAKNSFLQFLFRCLKKDENTTSYNTFSRARWMTEIV